MNPTQRSLAILSLGVLLSVSAMAQGKSNKTLLRSDRQLNSILAQDPSVQKSSDWILAVVNHEPITYRDLRSRVLRISVQLLHAGQPLPPADELEEAILEKMINDRALVQDAKEMGMRVDEDSVQGAMQNLASRSQMTESELLRKLRDDGISVLQLRADLRDELLLEKIHEHHINNAKVSEAEIDNWLAEQARLTGDASYERINLAQILVAVPEGASPQEVERLRARAQDLAQQARLGSFAKIAESYSDGSRELGGSLGLRLKDQLPEVFIEATDHLKVGQVSAPVRSPAGFHILKVLERRTPSAVNTTIQTAVRHIILRQDDGQDSAELVAKLRKIRQDIVSGKISFEQAAAQYSQDGSAEHGGNLGWAEPGQFVPEFESVMNSLEPHRLSDPIVTRFGAHLLEVLDRQRVEISPQQQREMAKQALKKIKGEEDYKIWTDEVRARAYVELRQNPHE